MEIKQELPERKHPRLKNYDYSSAGAYFITICTAKRKNMLSRIVGRGLAPAEMSEVEYTSFGKIAEEQLLLLENRYPNLWIDTYVIMPNHIHVVFVLDDKAAGASPRPTITDVVCAYKSLTTIACKKKGLDSKLFQDSFHDHIIRDGKDYDKIVEYIHQNPTNWYYDDLYGEEY